MSLVPGTRFGPYELMAALGAGGMGEVYTARDTRLDRTVAIKVLPTHLSSDSDARARFDREARAIAGLNHPNICTLYDVGVTDAGAAYLVMELLEGETLQERLVRGPIEVNALVDHGLALADALDAAHSRGIIHRDLKPANIFLTSRGGTKILDFGLAKAVDALDDTTRQADALTGMGTTVGTVAYMSPEQLRAEPLDGRTDLFSLGLVLYEMATGQRAFSGTTSAVVSAAILGQQPAPPRTIRADLPARLEDVILKALEKDRQFRCQTAAELRADLLRAKRQTTVESVLETQAPSYVRAAASPTIPATSGDASTPPPKRRSKWLLPLAAILLLVIGVGATVWYYRTCCSPPPLTPMETFPATPPASLRAANSTPAPPTTPPAPAPSSPPPARNVDRPSAPPPSAPPVSAPPSSATPPDARAGAPPPDAGFGGRNNGPGRNGPGRAGPGRANFAPALANLTNSLKGLPPQTCEAGAVNDPRPRLFVGELVAALNAAGWTCTDVGIIPGFDAATNAPFTIQVPRQSPGANALRQWATRMNFSPDFRILPRLPQVRIVVGVLKEPGRGRF
jgi:serine/threonine protein kinase